MQDATKKKIIKWFWILVTAPFALLAFLLLLVWMFRTLFKIYIKPYSQRPEYVYLLAVYAINIAQCLLNTLSIEIVFVYLIPLFMSLSSQKSDKKMSMTLQQTYN